MPLSHSPERGIIFTNFSLVLQKISQAQAGAYLCESSNKVGKGRSEDIVLDVKCKLRYIFLNFGYKIYVEIFFRIRHRVEIWLNKERDDYML